jgi:acetyl esterase
VLDAQTQALLDELAANPAPPMWEMTPAQWREAHHAFFMAHNLPDADLVDTEDRELPGPHGPIRIRIYRPREQDAPDLRAGLVYYHGGGMVSNSIETYDALCQRLSERSGAIVVSVDYRLAPEHKFPIPVDDAYAAAAWLHENAAAIGIDPMRLAVGGDSAGGNLTAAVTQLAKERGGPPFAFQLLIYPALGSRGHSFSLAEFAKGYLFERDELDFVYTQYASDPADARDPRLSPILARDLAGLPPAFVVTAGHDILRDDGEDYVELLRTAGVPAELHRYEQTIHAFLNLAGSIDAGREAIDECADKLREALAKPEQSGPYEVAFENEYVRIVHVTLGEGEQPPAYEPAAGAVVRVDLDAKTVNYQGEPVQDVAGGALREVRVELRGAPETQPSELDAVELDPDRYRVELENERVRVVRLSFAPGEEGLMVTHPPRVLVTLTDVHVRVVFADGRTDERGAPAGIAGWLVEETLQTVNAGEQPLEVVLVEPKS